MKVSVFAILNSKKKSNQRFTVRKQNMWNQTNEITKLNTHKKITSIMPLTMNQTSHYIFNI